MVMFDDFLRVEMWPVARGVGVVGYRDGESARAGGSERGVDTEVGRAAGDDQVGDGVTFEERLESGVQERVACRFLFDGVFGGAVEAVEKLPRRTTPGQSFARIGVLDENDRSLWANAMREPIDAGDGALGIMAGRRAGKAAELHVDDQKGDHGVFPGADQRKPDYPMQRSSGRGVETFGGESP